MTPFQLHTTGNEQLWFKDAVIYQLHVKSFMDSNADGIGDFQGLTQQLDYLEDLGINVIWLLPFYPSPLRDDGYDIGDYKGIHSSYGSMRDFKTFMREAHRRDIKVITELVINHTSDQHAWFKRARKSPPGSSARNFYVWSKTSQLYEDARIIFKDFETSNWTWDAEAEAYYWHRFYSHQPDLNFENPEVQRELLKVIDFWMELGVDGMRLDAVPYLYEQEGTMCENLPQTYEFLRKLRGYIDNKYAGRMLLAEANQWPEDAAAYFGMGDICQMAFHFPLMPRMFMALQMEDWFPIVDILEQTPEIPESCQWAIFLRNHDELTLEMVTEEERDYMYRYYAHDPSSRINVGIRRRLAPLLNNSRRRIEIMNILLFSLPGTPIIYYGDEIGMGDNHYLGDRNGVRTPMQWNADRNAGFSRANPQKVFLPTIIDPEYHYEALNVETHQQNTSSLLWWMKRVIAMRRKYKAFSQGTIQFIKSENASIFTFVRRFEDEIILVAINLSRFTQAVSLDLREFAGFIPHDIFSDNRFPAIGEAPYILTMGFHDYFWLQLENAETIEKHNTGYEIPEFTINSSWSNLFGNSHLDVFEQKILPVYLQSRRTAGCQDLPIKETHIVDRVTVKNGDHHIIIFIISVYYRHGGKTDKILLPLTTCPAELLDSIIKENTGLVLAKVKGSFNGYIYDCSLTPLFHESLLKLITGNRKVNGLKGTFEGMAAKTVSRGFRKYAPSHVLPLKSGRFSTSFDYGGAFHFRLYRRLEDGVRPDVEVGAFISQKINENDPFPKFTGAITYSNRSERSTFGVMTTFVKNTGTAWNLSLDAALQFFEDILSKRKKDGPPALSDYRFYHADPSKAKDKIVGQIGAFCATAELLGQKTAQLHRTLMSKSDNVDLTPEPMSKLYQRSLYQSLRTKTKRIIANLRKVLTGLTPEEFQHCNAVAIMEQKILDVFGFLLRESLSSMKIRIHGNLCLSQFLSTGNDFAIKDYRGPVDMPLSERRLKRSPLRDIAGIIYSLNKVTFTALYSSLRVSTLNPEELEQWAEIWFTHNSNVFLKAYIDAIGNGTPKLFDKKDVPELLKLFFLEQALTDLEDAIKTKNDDLYIAARAIGTILKDEVDED